MINRMLQLARGSTRREEARAGLISSSNGGSRSSIPQYEQQQQQRGKYQYNDKSVTSSANLQYNIDKQQSNEINTRSGILCTKLDPPTGFSDQTELTDPEASNVNFNGRGQQQLRQASLVQRNRHQRLRDFVIAV